MKRTAIALTLLLAGALPGHHAVIAAAPATEASIEQRLQRAEDELEIRRILVDYHWALDHRDIDAYVALFARNGEWINGSIVRKGPSEIRELLEGLFANRPISGPNRESLHLTTNIQVDVQGDRAEARSRHLLIRRGPDGRPVPTLSGRYEDVLIREDGKWKILRRVDFPVMPTPEEWQKRMAERSSGQ